MSDDESLGAVQFFAEEFPQIIEGKGVDEFTHKVILKQVRAMVVKELRAGRTHWIPAVCAVHVITEALGGLEKNPPMLDERFDVSVEGTTVTIRSANG